MSHSDNEVNRALVRLNDALCTYERNTGIESVLILREQRGWFHRSVSGKPNVPDDIPDDMLMRNILGKEVHFSRELAEGR